MKKTPNKIISDLIELILTPIKVITDDYEKHHSAKKIIGTIEEDKTGMIALDTFYSEPSQSLKS